MVKLTKSLQPQSATMPAPGVTDPEPAIATLTPQAPATAASQLKAPATNKRVIIDTRTSPKAKKTKKTKTGGQ
jgi:hypothetical protein